jgi:alkyl sulfatase BDS1-like metallo-beta-lactamase superfamily hydrolase
LRFAPPIDQVIAPLLKGEFVNRHRIRIDPVNAKDTDATIRFEFTDAANKAVALHVRRGVVEYVDNPDRHCRQPDLTLSLTREAWTKLHLNQATVAQLAGAGELKITGDAAACDRVLDLFAKLDAA